MTIPYLPGWGDQLAQILPQLGQNLSKVINPNQDQQMMLKQAIIKDPSLLNQYGKLARENPDVFAKMGFGDNLSKMISGIQPTNEEKLDEEIYKDPNLRKEIKSRKATGQNTGQIAQTTASTNRDIAATETENQTRPTVIEQGKATLAHTKAITEHTKLDTEIMGLGLKQSQRQAKEFEDAVKKYPDLANLNVAQFASDHFSGKPTDPVLEKRIFGDPNLAAGFKAYYDAMENRAKNALEHNRLDLLGKSELNMAMAQVTKDRTAAINELKTTTAAISKYELQKKSAMDMVDQMTAKEVGNDKNPTPQAREAQARIAAKEAEIQTVRDRMTEAQNTLKYTESMMKALQKRDPSLKAAMDEVMGSEGGEDSTTGVSVGTPTIDESRIKKESPKLSDSTSLNPVVLRAQEALKLLGEDKLKQTEPWKKLTKEEQDAVLGKTPKKSSAVPNKNKQSPDTAGLKERGPGLGATVGPAKLSPMDTFKQRFQQEMSGVQSTNELNNPQQVQAPVAQQSAAPISAPVTVPSAPQVANNPPIDTTGMGAIAANLGGGSPGLNMATPPVTAPKTETRTDTIVDKKGGPTDREVTAANGKRISASAMAQALVHGGLDYVPAGLKMSKQEEAAVEEWIQFIKNKK